MLTRRPGSLRTQNPRTQTHVQEPGKLAKELLMAERTTAMVRRASAKENVSDAAAGVKSFERIRQRAGRGGGKRQLHGSDDFGAGAGCAGFRERKARGEDLAAGDREAGGGSDDGAARVGEGDGSGARSGGSAGRCGGVIYHVDLDGLRACDADGRKLKILRMRGC